MALPVLLRRLAQWRTPGINTQVLPPIRVAKDRFLNRPMEFERHLQLAAAKCGDEGWVLLLLDADDDSTEPMAVVVTLAPEAGGTRITQVMTFPTAEMCRGALTFGADRLGQTTLAKLDAAAQKL